MMKSAAASILLCCGIISGSLGQSNNKSKEISLFSINKKPVAAQEFIYLYRKNHQNKPEEFAGDKIEEYLDLFINFKLKVEEARRRGLDTTAAFKKEYNTYREELRKPYLPDSRLVDSLVTLTYERMKEEVRVSHILINLKPDAPPEDTLKAYNRIMELHSRISNGEDFAGLAGAFSEEPSAKLNQGDLGYFTAMQMVFPFEQAAYQTGVGKLSMPLRTQFGYHILKVADRKPARGEVEVSHIMIRADETGEDKARNAIFDVHDKLQKGVQWDEMVREYSQDFSTKDKGGKLRPFGVGTMSSVPEFERIAFALQKPGEISDPFETQYGWHIIKLDAKIPLPSFTELSASLKNRVSRDERVQISKQALQSKIKKDFGFSENQTSKMKVMALADSSLSQGTWKKEISAELAKEALFSLQGKTFLVSDFVNYIQRNQKPNPATPDRYFTQLYTNFTDEILGQLLEEKIIRLNPDYSWLLKEYYEGILLFEIMEKEIWNKATEDSVGQLKYFNEYRSQYRAGERVNASIFSASSGASLEQLKSFIASGDSLKILDYSKVQKIRQETGSFEKSDRPVLNKVTWAPGCYSAENNGLNYLVWIKNMVPPGSRSFDEARAAVVSDYQNYLEKSWIEKLKKKYPVKINKKGKQFVMQQLVKR